MLFKREHVSILINKLSCCHSIKVSAIKREGGQQTVRQKEGRPALSAGRPLCTVECFLAEQQSPRDVSDSPGALGFRRLEERLRKP